MFVIIFEIIIYFVHISELNSEIVNELFCDNTKSGKTSSVTFYSEDNPNTFINEVDKLLDSMKDNLVYLDAPYGICIGFHYIFYEEQWIIFLNLAPDDQTSERTTYVNNKYQTISIDTIWSLDDKPSYGTIVEPRNIRIYYQCSYYSECILDYVKYLLRNHTNWLVKDHANQYIQLWREFENILIQPTQVETSKNRECYKSETNVGPCSKSTIVCKATIIDIKPKNQQCGERKYSHVQLHLKIRIQTKDDLFKRTIDFTCKFNRCNSQQTSKRIRQVIDNHFDFLPFLTTTLLKIQPSTTHTQSTRSTTSKTITTNQIKTAHIINTTRSYPITDYQTQSSELTRFYSIIQNETQSNQLTTFYLIIQNETRFNVRLTTELVINNDTLPSASIHYFMISIILFHLVFVLMLL